MKFLRKENPWPILKRVSTVIVSGVSRFVAADAFGPDNPDGIQFYLQDNFKKYLLDKVEENIPAGKLAVHKLVTASLDAPIMAEIGDHIETALAYLYELIRDQANGQFGPLLIEGYTSIFYIRDAKGRLLAVYMFYLSSNRGWFVNASFVESPSEWGAGSQIFSQAA